VLGKGNKRRTVYFSRETAKVLSHYLRKAGRQETDPVFLSRSGGSGAPLTRSGLQQLVTALGKQAGIKGMQVSPHVFRHSAAIQLLRNGCDVYSLMSILGHASLTTCQTYLKLSKLDVANQHRRYSPVESLSKRKAQLGDGE
jgi:integrase/recombinase XerD